MATVTDTTGKKWRVDSVILGDKARKAQICPGFAQINLSPPASDVRNHLGLSLPEWMIAEWRAHRIRVRVTGEEEATP